MNILIAAKQLKRTNGGVCTHILDLCKGYAQTGHQIVLLADGTDYQTQIDAIESLFYQELPFEKIQSNPKIMFTCFRTISKICKQRKVDIIHLHGQCLIPIAWLIRVTTGIPFLWTNHIDDIPRVDILRIMQKIMRFTIISVSTDLRNQMLSELKIQPKYVHVVNNGIDTAPFVPLNPKECEALQEKFDIEPGDYVVAELARLTYGKGQDLLIRAIHTVQKRHPELKIKVIFAGTGDQEWFQRKVMEYAAENGLRAGYFGFQSPRDVFGISDLYVLPSLFEGFALACIEALMMECPVVRSNSPGWSDMKDFCVTCEKSNLDDLTEKIEYAVKHQKEMKDRALRGKTYSQTVFTHQHMTEETLDVYKKIME